MPIMEATLEQSYQGQQIINRFNYLATGTPAAVFYSFALATSMGAIFDQVAVPPGYPASGLMRRIADLQTNGVNFVSLRVINVYDFVDFYEAPFVQPLTGESSDDGLPPFASIGFRSNVIRRDIRRGTKRFVGAGEGIQDNGNITGASTQIANLEAALSETLTYDDQGNTLTFSPCVVKRQRYDPDTGEADPNGRAYRYFPTQVEQEANIAEGVVWTAYDTIRSQTSRQFGRGR